MRYMYMQIRYRMLLPYRIFPIYGIDLNMQYMKMQMRFLTRELKKAKASREQWSSWSERFQSHCSLIPNLCVSPATVWPIKGDKLNVKFSSSSSCSSLHRKQNVPCILIHPAKPVYSQKMLWNIHVHCKSIYLAHQTAQAQAFCAMTATTYTAFGLS